MPSSYDFYIHGLGDRLADPTCHPAGITAFLEEEQRIVNLAQHSFDQLIEVGCMNGRYLDWAIDHRKSYLGIDIVKQYIEEGRQTVIRRALSPQTYQFVIGDAEEIDHVIIEDHLRAERDRCLLLFPFNSFGNMEHVEQVLVALRHINLPFFISSYQTTDYAAACRHEYFKRCGYKDICISSTEQGVLFTSSDGLHSLAYYPEYLLKICREHELAVTATLTSKINVTYTTRTLLRGL